MSLGLPVDQGLTIIAYRAIMHSAEHFDDPMAFNPDRYLKDGKINPKILDPEAGAFGYGRRYGCIL
jgi:cytochrome P450